MIVNENNAESASMNDNVDWHEVAKFEALASRWWDPDSEFKPLHQINPLRLEYINSIAPLAGKSVLDVGCGGGILTEAMAREGAIVTGIDMGKAPLAVAKLHARANSLNIEYLHTTAEQLHAQSLDDTTPTDAALFDVVTCMEMLEHVPDPAAVVAACSKLLKPNGKAFFSTINRTPKAWAFAIVGAEYMLRLLPVGTHEYDKFIRPSELHSWCNDSGINIQSFTGMHYNPITSNYWLAPGCGVNYLGWGSRSST